MCTVHTSSYFPFNDKESLSDYIALFYVLKTFTDSLGLSTFPRHLLKSSASGKQLMKSISTWVLWVYQRAVHRSARRPWQQQAHLAKGEEGVVVSLPSTELGCMNMRMRIIKLVVVQYESATHQHMY